MKYYCSITSGNATVNFVSSRELYDRFSSKEYMRFIPEMMVCRSNLASTPWRVTYEEDTARRLSYRIPTVQVKFPWEFMRDGETIAYLAYPLLERQRQEHGIVTMHAASCSVGAKACLLLGKEGAGKTSVLIEVCRTHGARLIANDLCLCGGVNEPHVYGGTKFLQLRRESIARNLPELLSLFPPQGDKDSWLDKIFLNISKLGIRIETASNLPVARAFHLHIDDRQKELFEEPADDLPMRLFLNENLSRYIRTTSTTMLGGDRYDILGYIPSLDTKELFVYRKNLINRLLYDIRIIYLSGTIKHVAQRIANMMHA